MNNVGWWHRKGVNFLFSWTPRQKMTIILKMTGANWHPNFVTNCGATLQFKCLKHGTMQAAVRCQKNASILKAPVLIRSSVFFVKAMPLNHYCTMYELISVVRFSSLLCWYLSPIWARAAVHYPSVCRLFSPVIARAVKIFCDSSFRLYRMRQQVSQDNFVPNLGKFVNIL